MRFVVVFGPCAVGKATVGAALARLVPSFRLFHNHMTIEPVLPFFAFDSPSFRRLVGLFRRELIEEIVRQQACDLVFTFVWALDDPRDTATLRRYTDLVEQGGGEVYFVELEAPQEVRLAREGSADRIAAKPSKADLAAAQASLRSLDAAYRLNTRGTPLPLPHPHLVLDTTTCSPDACAHRIAEHFGWRDPRVA